MKRSNLKKVWLLALVLALSLTLMGATTGGQTFVVELTGAAEVPGPGDPDGSGTAYLTLNRGLEQVCWTIHVSDITLPATGAHIHVINPALGFGPVVVALSPPDATGHSSGCTSADRELIKAITKDPTSYYVNVHNADYPAGAVRGDLR